MPDRPRSPRTLMVADHLWDALAAMAADMGTDREALVNQALYTFARLNGFVLPAEVRGAEPRAPEARSASSPPLHALETPLVARPVSVEVEQELPMAAPAPQAAPVPEKPVRAARAPIPDLGDLDPDTPPRPAAAAATPTPAPAQPRP